MKKLLVVLMVLSMVTIANAGLVISVNGQIDPPDTTIELLPSDHVIIDVHGIAPSPANIDAWLVVGPLGTATGGVLLYPGDQAFMARYDASDETGTFAWLTGVMGPASSGYYLSFGDSQARPTEGPLVDEILFHCDAPGDVVITLANIFDDGTGNPIITVLDTQVIHQIPEPMTMGLLGLGGLFLRRRK